LGYKIGYDDFERCRNCGKSNRVQEEEEDGGPEELNGSIIDMEVKIVRDASMD
jgi:hypothetical protein